MALGARTGRQVRELPSPSEKSLFSKFIFKKMEFILKVSKVEGASLFLK